MNVVKRLVLQRFKIGLDPIDALVQALVKTDLVLPAKLRSQLGAVELIGCILAQPLANDLRMVFKPDAEFLAQLFNQLADGDHFVRRYVVGVAVPAVKHDLQGGVAHVVHVYEGSARHAAAMQLELPAEQDEQDGAGNDAVELLAGAIDVGRARGDHREVVGRKERVQAHVAGRPRHGIRRAGVEGGVFGDKTGTGPVHLGGRDVDIALEKVTLAQFVMQLDGGHGIGHEPVVRVAPAFRHHALRSKVHHIGCLVLPDQCHQVGQIPVDVELMEVEFTGTLGPFVGQEGRVRLRGAAAPHDVVAALQQMVNETRP